MRKRTIYGIIGVLVLFILTLIGCDQQSHRKGLLVHNYKQVNKEGLKTSTTDDDILFWYIIWGHENQTAYYYTSTSPISDFTSLSFSYADKTVDLFNTMNSLAEELNPIFVDEQSLPEDLVVDMEMNNQEFSEAFTVNDNQAEEDNASNDDTDATTDDSSSDSDSGDSGDSGGGDSGGDGGE